MSAARGRGGWAVGAGAEQPAGTSSCSSCSPAAFSKCQRPKEPGTQHFFRNGSLLQNCKGFLLRRCLNIGSKTIWESARGPRQGAVQTASLDPSLGFVGFPHTCHVKLYLVDRQKHHGQGQLSLLYRELYETTRRLYLLLPGFSYSIISIWPKAHTALVYL